MDTDRNMSNEVLTDHDVFPRRTACRVCGAPFRLLILDRRFCSYACVGVPVPDVAGPHPATCWTWDGKPKMCFFTPELAETMRESLGIPGVVSYYCGIHHLWHVGYDVEERHDGRMADMTSDEDVARYRALESYIPSTVGRPGTHINDVERIVGHARNVCLHFDESATALDRWREWYGLWVQMLQDGHQMVPPGYKWDRVTLTC
jgi:hypothetical protein